MDTGSMYFKDLVLLNSYLYPCRTSVYKEITSTSTTATSTIVFPVEGPDNPSIVKDRVAEYTSNSILEFIGDKTFTYNTVNFGTVMDEYNGYTLIANGYTIVDYPDLVTVSLTTTVGGVSTITTINYSGTLFTVGGLTFSARILANSNAYTNGGSTNSLMAILVYTKPVFPMSSAISMGSTLSVVFSGQFKSDGTLAGRGITYRDVPWVPKIVGLKVHNI
jgi:hypothetical protein